MIRQLSFEEAAEWYATLPESQRIATLSPAYMLADAQRDRNIVPYFWGYREGAQLWLHGVHRSPIPDLDLFDQQSPYGYGGPVCNSDSPDFIARAWAAYSEACRQDRVLAEFVRLHPVANGLQFYHSTTRAEREVVLIDLAVDDLRASFSTRCRTAIRKALKSGVQVGRVEPALIQSRFADFYREGMRTIGATDFYLFNDAYFQSFSRWESAELIVCERDGEWLSAGLFLTDGRLMEYHLSSTTAEGRALGATNLLIDAAAYLARERGCTHLYLGGGTTAQADNPLFFFKKSFSSLTRPFIIGFTAFMPEDYAALRTEYMRRGQFKDRYLFYRT